MNKGLLSGQKTPHRHCVKWPLCQTAAHVYTFTRHQMHWFSPMARLPHLPLFNWTSSWSFPRCVVGGQLRFFRANSVQVYRIPRAIVPFCREGVVVQSIVNFLSSTCIFLSGHRFRVRSSRDQKSVFFFSPPPMKLLICEPDIETGE